MIQINTNDKKVNIIQVYAPTADKTDNEIDSFYEDLENILKPLKHKTGPL